MELNTTDGFIGHYNRTIKYLDKINEQLYGFCPKLLDFPSIQTECYRLWKIILNIQTEIHLSNQEDELKQIDDQLYEIEKELLKILKEFYGSDSHY